MSQQQLLKRLIDVLDVAGIEYMLTGSIVSSLQGQPRSTHDIDVVVEISPPDVRSLLRAFPPPDFYLDEEAGVAAVESGGMFNLLDVREGDKVDFWVLTDEPFDRSRFSRRYFESFGGKQIRVSRPEDTILMKLNWAKLSAGSERQFADAVRVYEVQQPGLDVDYLERWATELGVGESWQRLKQEAQPL